MNSLSLVLVVVAAVTFGLGWFQDGLALVYVSIATCLIALALIGVDHLLRRRAASEPTPAGDAAASMGDATPVPRVAGDARPGSVDAIAAADPAELSQTPGIGTGLAEAIEDQLA